MQRQRLLWCVIGSLWLVQPAAPQAQGVFDMGGLTNSLSMGAVVQSDRERAARGTGPGPASAPPRASLRFAADPARRRANLARFVERIRDADPAGGAPLVRFLTGQDVFGIMGRGMSAYGLRLDDAADAAAVYLVAAWLATRGSDGNPTPAQMAGVRRQVAWAMAANPAASRATDAARQERADAAILQAAVIGAAVSGAQGDAQGLARLRSTVAAGARSSTGLDLLSLELSDAGLRPAR